MFAAIWATLGTVAGWVKLGQALFTLLNRGAALIQTQAERQAGEDAANAAALAAAAQARASADALDAATDKIHAADGTDAAFDQTFKRKD